MLIGLAFSNLSLLCFSFLFIFMILCLIKSPKVGYPIYPLFRVDNIIQLFLRFKFIIIKLVTLSFCVILMPWGLLYSVLNTLVLYKIKAFFFFFVSTMFFISCDYFGILFLPFLLAVYSPFLLCHFLPTECGALKLLSLLGAFLKEKWGPTDSTCSKMWRIKDSYFVFEKVFLQ